MHAECLFTGFLLEHNLPLAAADHVGPLLRKMFQSSETAKRYACARTKRTAIVGEMTSHYQERVVSVLKRRVFAVATDCSNDSEAQLYPIVVTYYVQDTGLVESRLLCLITLQGQATGRNIGKLGTDSLASFDIPVANCVAFCSDNANVMIGKNGVAAALDGSARKYN